MPEEIVVDKIKVPTEQAVTTVASTKWATHWGEGIAKLTGLTPSTKEYHDAVERLRFTAARRLLGVGSPELSPEEFEAIKSFISYDDANAGLKKKV
ncbi:MAG: hypothetical protein ACUVTD_08745, partial [Nitrososphaerales archaeon]